MIPKKPLLDLPVQQLIAQIRSELAFTNDSPAISSDIASTSAAPESIRNTPGWILPDAGSTQAQALYFRSMNQLYPRAEPATDFPTAFADDLVDGDVPVSDSLARSSLVDISASTQAVPPANVGSAFPWRDADGDFDPSVPLGELLGHLIRGKADDTLIKAYAEYLCKDCFDEEADLEDAFYNSTEPYDIAMDLRNNESIDTADIDGIDTLRQCRVLVGDHRTEWVDLAAEDIFGSVQGLVHEPPGDIAQAYSGLRTRIDSFFMGEARGLMYDYIRDWFKE